MYLVVVAVSASHHEMWRDEIQAWLIGRDSASLSALLRNIAYEGHPPLWYLCLMVLSRFFRSPTSMQVLCAVIATATVYVFAKYAPYSRVQKFLFAFGYYSVYEYSVLARDYVLSPLLLFVACTLCARRPRPLILISGVLCLLAYTTVYGTIIAIAMAVGLFVDHLVSRDGMPADGRPRKWRAWVALGIIILGVVTAAWCMIPPSDSGFAVGWHFSLDPNRARLIGKIVGRAFLPLPHPGRTYWGSFWLEEIPQFGKFEAAVGFLIVGWCCLGLLRKPAAFLMFASGTFGLIAFFYVKHIGHVRHWGSLLLVLLAALWFQHSCEEVRWFRGPRFFSGFWESSMRSALTAILFVGLMGGAVATAMDFHFVFSNGERTAEFIRDNHLQNLPMVGDPDAAASTVVGYLGIRGMYYPRGGRFGSFIKWDRARTSAVPVDEVIQDAKRLKSESGDSVLLVLNYPLPREAVNANALINLTALTGAANHDEDYYLYLMPQDSQGSGAVQRRVRRPTIYLRRGQRGSVGGGQVPGVSHRPLPQKSRRGSAPGSSSGIHGGPVG